MKKLELFNIILGGAVISSLMACSSIAPPKSEVIQAANFGEKPSIRQMTEAVKTYWSASLFDPYSAKYTCTTPTKMWIIGGGGTGGNAEYAKTYFGYAADCSVNAKNKLGAYTGSKAATYMLYMRSGARYLVHFDGYQSAGQVP